jgi:hypothetical protein
MITVAIDTRAFVASLDEIAKSQIPFAVSRSLNELGKLAQLAIRNHTGQIWNVKRASLGERGREDHALLHQVRGRALSLDGHSPARR